MACLTANEGMCDGALVVGALVHVTLHGSVTARGGCEQCSCMTTYMRNRNMTESHVSGLDAHRPKEEICFDYLARMRASHRASHIADAARRRS